MPLCFHGIDIGPGNQHSVVCDVSECVPDLLAIHNPLVAVAYRSGPEASKVATSPRLAKQLTPPFFAGEHWSEETILDLGGAVGNDCGTREVHKKLHLGSGRCARITERILYIPLELGTNAQPASTLWKVNPCDAVVILVPAKLFV